MKATPSLPSLAAFALTALGCAVVASAASAPLTKAGPRDTIRVPTSLPQPLDAQFASLSVDAAELARPARAAKSKECSNRVGPRETIRTCQ